MEEGEEGANKEKRDTYGIVTIHPHEEVMGWKDPKVFRPKMPHVVVPDGRVSPGRCVAEEDRPVVL